jgi:hypothetical protein
MESEYKRTYRLYELRYYLTQRNKTFNALRLGFSTRIIIRNSELTLSKYNNLMQQDALR